MTKVLVANRGEIAVRIIRACRQMGLESIAVYSEADKDSLHVRLADKAVCIGPYVSQKSYLNIEAIMAVAKAYEATALHPGVGFLSESVELRNACDEQGVIFIGPGVKSMELMGNKSEAREIMIENTMPVVPGSNGAVNDCAEAKKIAEEVGYPVMLKASRGGGGGGIRVVREPKEFERLYSMVKIEAKASFGDDSIYIERFLENTRHIEVQILADQYGKTLHFGTRECSLQRKNQKLIEESPAPFLSDELRGQIETTAVKIAQIMDYTNAGTVEFLVTQTNEFFFMEMNTRIQVEHPVTEMAYGIDLVQAQICVALGQSLTINQEEIEPLGHAMECRINAESPEDDFRPSPGKIKTLHLPGGPTMRVDTGFCAGDTLSPFYDSLIMKVIAADHSREATIKKLYYALEETVVEGIKHNIDYQMALLNAPEFSAGEVYTKWIEEVFHKRYVEMKHEKTV